MTDDDEFAPILSGAGGSDYDVRSWNVIRSL